MVKSIKKENPTKQVGELTTISIQAKIRERGQTLIQLQAQSKQLQQSLVKTTDQINQMVGAIKQLQDLLPKK
jgi:flagellar hook-associated protein FlgK